MRTTSALNLVAEEYRRGDGDAIIQHLQMEVKIALELRFNNENAGLKPVVSR